MATKIVKKMLDGGRIDGLIGRGGATNTSMTSDICTNLPFGLPKIILSSVVGMGKYNFIGRTDVALFATVADTDTMNLFLREVFSPRCV